MSSMIYKSLNSILVVIAHNLPTNNGLTYRLKPLGRGFLLSGFRRTTRNISEYIWSLSLMDFLPMTESSSSSSKSQPSTISLLDMPTVIRFAFSSSWS